MSENQTYIDGLYSGLTLAEVITALNAGLKVERCSINESGLAVSWFEVTNETRDIDAFGPNRYRILVPDAQDLPAKLQVRLDCQNEGGGRL